MDCHFLLQGIFLTQGLNPGLPHCRRILYQVSHKGCPKILEWVAYPFSSRSFPTRNWTRVSCIAGRFFTNWAIREAPILLIFFFIFKLYNIVLVLPNIEMNPPQVYPCSPSWTLLPPHTLPLGRPSAPAPSIQHRASNLDWRLISYMILYMLQCHSPKSPHPLPLPQSPQDWSIHQCLFCCLVHRVIVTIFLNSIYMR